MFELFEHKNQCCGCGACASACPKDAIIMKEDQCGFIYPSINEEKCIECGICKKNCAFGKCTGNKPIESYAASNTNSVQKKESSSAGIFAAVAEQFIVNKGVVIGSEMVYEAGQAIVRHTIVDTIKEIKKLQGSKYVQSTVDCYKNIEQELKKGKNVLFTGTPCQVAQIKKNFEKYEKQLFTIDLICHGVPNQRIFNDYLKQLEINYNGKVLKFLFRDKEYGWGLTASVEIDNRGKNIRKYFLEPDTSSYYSLFLEGEIYRDSCYNCPYANLERVGDLTIGDYWGVEKFSPEILKENGGTIEKVEGVSCVLKNTEKGNVLLNMVEKHIEKVEVDIEKILMFNTQLRKPTEYTKIRDNVLDKYSKYGYKAVEQSFQNKLSLRKMIRGIKSIVPHRVKKIIKIVIRRK